MLQYALIYATNLQLSLFLFFYNYPAEQNTFDIKGHIGIEVGLWLGFEEDVDVVDVIREVVGAEGQVDVYAADAGLGLEVGKGNIAGSSTDGIA
jgi:hypothetical protein